MLLNTLEIPGSYKAICMKDGIKYEQDFEIKDGYRLGTSVFKKAYTFDKIDYSFILMKDRLLLFDEKKNVLLTENQISPSKIRKVDEHTLLFVTKIEEESYGLCNFGLFNIPTLTITDELIDKFKNILIDEKNKRIWLFDTRK